MSVLSVPACSASPRFTFRALRDDEDDEEKEDEVYLP
jgi:hypothetical protein